METLWNSVLNQQFPGIVTLLPLVALVVLWRELSAERKRHQETLASANELRREVLDLVTRSRLTPSGERSER